MTSIPTHSIRIAALLAVALVAWPHAGAVPDLGALEGQAEAMQHEGLLRERGALSLYRAFSANASQAPELELTATSAHGLYFEGDKVNMADLYDVNMPVQPSSLGSASSPLESVRLQATGAMPEFDLRIIAIDPIPFDAGVHGRIDLAGLRGAQMTHYGGIQERDETVENSPTDRSQHGFIHRDLDERVILTQAAGGTIDFQAEGDFILEFYGLDVLVEDGNGTRSISTSHTTRAGEDTTSTTLEHRKFLRLFVENATLQFRHSDVDRLVQWTSSVTHVRGDGGTIGFTDLRDDGGARLQDQQVRFASGYTGTLTPGGDGLTLALAETPSSYESSSSMWLPPTGFNPLPIAAALLAVALVTLTVRSLRTPPPLAHMESALEAGAFSRAARLAGRILRKDPNRESAHLGRAIALSRSGRPERVVRDLQPYLAGNEPSDGTLHYVLGLAYQDLGKERDAAKALSEAVRRTPALAQQVGEAAEPEQWAAPEGDAQGYT